MPAPAAALPIAVYGATGYTGDLVIAELRRLGLDVVACGRRADALAQVAARHGLDPATVPVSTIAEGRLGARPAEVRLDSTLAAGLLRTRLRGVAEALGVA